MKRSIALLLLALLGFVMTACSPVSLMKQISEQAARYQDAAAEASYEETSPADASDEETLPADVDESAAWPSDLLPDTVPEIPGVLVTDVTEMDGDVIIAFKGCDQAIADAYVARLQRIGWEPWSESTEGGYYYADFELSGEALSFILDQENGIGTLMWLSGAAVPDAAVPGAAIIWPGDMLPDTVPEIPGVSVTNVAIMAGDVSVSFEGCSQAIADAYVQQLQTLGWDLGDESADSREYNADLSLDDEMLFFSWRTGDGTGYVMWMDLSDSPDEPVAWPGDMLPDTVPEIPGVSLEMIMQDADNVDIMFEGCDQAIADAYVAQLTRLGWNVAMEGTVSGMNYTDLSQSGATLVFSWYPEDGTGSLFYWVD